MILTNCRLIPQLSAGVETACGSIEIEDGKISRISEERDYSPEAVDCKGMTVLPGLIDLHTHITFLSGIGTGQLHSPMGLLAEAAEHTRHYLEHGFTTIRDCGSFHGVANYVKLMAAKGTIVAPDMIVCGKAFMPTEVEEGNPLGSHLIAADGVEEIWKAVRSQMAANADYIKIFASGAAANPNGVPTQAIMRREEVRAAVEAAEMKGTYVAAHCHSDAAVRLCSEEGVKTIEHATLVSDETLDYVLGKQNCYMIPTLAVMYVSDGPNKEYWEKRLGPMFSHCTRMVEKAYKAGARLGFGTDCTAGDVCYEKGIEFRFRSENCHMDNIDILLQATRYNAEIAGIENCAGEIREGLQADLILVDGKPDADISVMYKRPEKVWKKGKIVCGEK